MVVVTTCVGDHYLSPRSHFPSPTPSNPRFPSPTLSLTSPPPPPQDCSPTKSFKGGFYSAEQFKRKWLLFPGLVCTSVRRWPCTRKWGPWYAVFRHHSFQTLHVQEMAACVALAAPLFLHWNVQKCLLHWQRNDSTSADCCPKIGYLCFCVWNRKTSECIL